MTTTLAVDDETIRLVVADDGAGFDPAQPTVPDGPQGRGSLTMVGRAEATGGRFRIESRPQRGTRVSVELVR